MNNILKFCFLFLLGAVMVSCGETDVVESEVTFLPKLTITGASNLVLDCTTTSFSDPGIIAEEAGQEIPVVTNVEAAYFGSNTIDGPDSYSISYSAVNVDGIPGSAFRSVLVPPCNGDLVNSIAGTYISTVSRNGVIPSDDYRNLKYILIKENSPGVYQLSNADGGWYELGRNIGTAYGSPGIIVEANDISANDFSFPNEVEVLTFGGAIKMVSLEVDAASKTIVMTSDWRGDFIFEATLTQVEL